MKIAVVCISLLVTAFFIFFFAFAADIVEKSLNPIIAKPPYEVSEPARQMHGRLFIADLHSDSLLWQRDLLSETTFGQVDLPKLQRGNVALQAFTVVTKTPRNLNIERNTGDSDNIFWLSLTQRQPIENLFSLTKRALYQAAKLEEFSRRSGGKLIVIKTKRDLAGLVKARGESGTTGSWLGIEGAHALDGKVENVDLLFDAGFRMMSPSHFFDNEVGGSAHGVEKHGLTELGFQVIKKMESKGMLVDLAHASGKTIDDVLAIATKPVVVSHTGVRGTCDNQRNLSDDQLRRIAGTGGVIGIGFWDTAVCGSDAAAIGRAIRYTANIVGAEHVALGSDYDGSVKAPFDASGIALITDALVSEGFSENEIRLIMGENTKRLLESNLPE